MNAHVHCDALDQQAHAWRQHKKHSGNQKMTNDYQLSQVTKYIKYDVLNRIQRDDSVEVLLAVESGSRMWDLHLQIAIMTFVVSRATKTLLHMHPLGKRLMGLLRICRQT